MNNISERLLQQIGFIKEIDNIKHIFRKTRLFNNTRFENDAEHSWHLAIMATVLSEYANEPVDTARVIKMVLVHDIVEIYAGDTFLYDEAGNTEKAKKEAESAERIFGMLPADQKEEFIKIWQEFEIRESPEAKFAAAIDRLEPLLQNYFTEGFTWKQHGIHREQVTNKNKPIILNGSKSIWEFANELLEESVAKGYLKEK